MTKESEDPSLQTRYTINNADWNLFKQKLDEYKCPQTNLQENIGNTIGFAAQTETG